MVVSKSDITHTGLVRGLEEPVLLGGAVLQGKGIRSEMKSNVSANTPISLVLKE